MYDYTQAKMNDDAIRAISSIGLAHLGDAVYELLVRTYLCVHGKATGKGLHRATVELVRAPKQAELAEAEAVTVSNNLQLKVSGNPSTRVGLNYIRQQYLDLSGIPIGIRRTDTEYCVTLPLL